MIGVLKECRTLLTSVLITIVTKPDVITVFCLLFNLINLD